MEVLWSPWRSKYIGTFKDEKKKDEEKCFFCTAISGAAEAENDLIVKKWKSCFAILNKFPYNNGHLLIAPVEHKSSFDELTDEELIELAFAVREAAKALQNHYKPHGFNIGLNLGRAAGAGVPGHLHYHIVPRWNGDTSFMATTDDIKVISESLEDTKEILIREFEKLSNG